MNEEREEGEIRAPSCESHPPRSQRVSSQEKTGPSHSDARRLLWQSVVHILAEGGCDGRCS